VGEHKLEPQIPWWYWTVRFDFRAHYRECYQRYREACGGVTPLDKLAGMVGALGGASVPGVLFRRRGR
jgi:hypothetical protein